MSWSAQESHALGTPRHSVLSFLCIPKLLTEPREQDSALPSMSCVTGSKSLALSEFTHLKSGCDHSCAAVIPEKIQASGGQDYTLETLTPRCPGSNCSARLLVLGEGMILCMKALVGNERVKCAADSGDQFGGCLICVSRHITDVTHLCRQSLVALEKTTTVEEGMSPSSRRAVHTLLSLQVPQSSSVKWETCLKLGVPERDPETRSGGKGFILEEMGSSRREWGGDTGKGRMPTQASQ